MLLTVLLMLASTTEPVEWTSETIANTWRPNRDIAELRVEAGTLSGQTIGADPMLTREGLEVSTTPWQYLEVELRASRPGQGAWYWTGDTRGPFGGLTEEKSLRFAVRGDGQFETICVPPCWQKETSIRTLRLDLYPDLSFAIRRIAIKDWAAGRAPNLDTRWAFTTSPPAWFTMPGTPYHLSPPLRLDANTRTWAIVTLQAQQEGAASFLWICADGGLESADFSFTARGAQTCIVPLKERKEWAGTIAAVGLRLPLDGSVKVDAVELAERPPNATRLDIERLAQESGWAREDRPGRVMVRVRNLGALPVNGARCTVKAGDAALPAQTIDGLAPGEMRDLFFAWTPNATGTVELTATVQGEGLSSSAKSQASVLPAQPIAKADYVPEPQPVKTKPEVLAYYFPGWESPAKWAPIRRIAPERRPLLGWYDEGRAEVVDWQIKWAVEHGISAFLVDWYWCKGQQTLTHWLDAYRKARYRDQLRIALMWANHNPPGSHSAADLQQAARYWLDQVFTLPSYYRLGARPAVFLWAPDRLRQDLGGSAQVRAAFDAVQRLAQQRGLEGIAFVALQPDFDAAACRMLETEGYSGITQYHEFGDALARSRDIRRARYADVVETAPVAWARKKAAAGALTFFPTADSGWDERPWAPNKALSVEGRTPALFEQLLRSAKAFAEKYNTPVLLGPMNEWGEGSYLEPCAEFGFSMLDSVRAVLGQGEPAAWPPNLVPEDVGLGPYEVGAATALPRWAFADGAGGWRALMNVDALRVENGALCFRTATNDPALTIDMAQFEAKQATRAVLRMQLQGNIAPREEGQLYWAVDGAPPSEATSLRFALQTDGQPHEYTLSLGKNPQWRGAITSLRFDPCVSAGITVRIEDLRFEP